jgi:hypothetical protein
MPRSTAARVSDRHHLTLHHALWAILSLSDGRASAAAGEVSDTGWLADDGILCRWYCQLPAMYRLCSASVFLDIGSGYGKVSGWPRHSPSPAPTHPRSRHRIKMRISPSSRRSHLSSERLLAALARSQRHPASSQRHPAASQAHRAVHTPWLPRLLWLSKCCHARVSCSTAVAPTQPLARPDTPPIPPQN